MNPHETLQLVIVFTIIGLLSGSIASLMIGMDLSFHQVQAEQVGRWRYSPLAWAIVASGTTIFALAVYSRNRRQILKYYPETNYAYRPEMLGVLLTAAIPAALAALLFVWVPVDQCNTPVRLQALETALQRPSNKMAYIHANSAELQKINLFTHEALCRAKVDIEWEGKSREMDYPIWYQVIHFNGGWGSHVSTALQENEDKYQAKKI